MKAVRFHKTGGPEVLVYEDVPDPAPRDWEVLIRVEAAGMNFADVMRRRGDAYPEPSPPPLIPGIEVAGTVAAVGNAVTSIEVGAPVFATPGACGYAQFICVPASRVIPLPTGIDAVHAAALVAHGLTAALTLRKAARLASGEDVLVEAAAGGVGSFAVQLAKLYGAGRVIAAASTPEKRTVALAHGADAAVDYTAPGWDETVRDLTGGRGTYVVLELVGDDTLGPTIAAMAPFGRLVIIGQASGKTALIDPWELTSSNHTVTGFHINSYLAFPDLIQPTLRELLAFVLAGQLSVHVGAVLPLSQTAEGLRFWRAASPWASSCFGPGPMSDPAARLGANRFPSNLRR
jgi:NADPH2:quinone reductase